MRAYQSVHMIFEFGTPPQSSVTSSKNVNNTQLCDEKFQGVFKYYASTNAPLLPIAVQYLPQMFM